AMPVSSNGHGPGRSAKRRRFASPRTDGGRSAAVSILLHWEPSMKTFTDAAGRTWTIALNLGTAMAVKAKLDIDLLQPEAGDPPLLTRLGTDEMLLGEVLCALLENQFEAHKVTDADVLTAFDGNTLLAAQKA